MDSHGPNGADSSALAQLISNLRDFLGIISTAARRLEPPSISYENTKMQLGRFKMWIDEFDTEKLPLTTILDGAKELTEGVVSLLTRLIACVVFEYGFCEYPKQQPEVFKSCSRQNSERFTNEDSTLAILCPVF